MSHKKQGGPARVQAALERAGLHVEVVQLPESTRTAKQAAEAVGCQVGQIAKSLIFQGVASGRPWLVIASGANRVEEAWVGNKVGEGLTLASPDFVRQSTGFAIGGVPPIGHSRAIRTLMDRDLLTHDRIWAAAGSPHAVFAVAPSDLVAAIECEVIAVRGEAG
jgi:prolyl-tRNA editing enzyme YbaK/EbsC (Cys-tRNA(Pro) deacylase)